MKEMGYQVGRLHATAATPHHAATRCGVFPLALRTEAAMAGVHCRGRPFSWQHGSNAGCSSRKTEHVAALYYGKEKV